MLKKIPALVGVTVLMLMSARAVAQTDEPAKVEKAGGGSPMDILSSLEAAQDKAEKTDDKAEPEKFDEEKAMVRGKMVYYADRGIILPLGTGEARVDLTVGLNKGWAGKVFGVGSTLASERNSGLTFRGTLWGPFEMGFSVQYLQSMYDGYDSKPHGNKDGTVIAPTAERGPEGDGTRRIAGYGYKLADGYNHFTPAYLYGRFKVVEQFGVEIGIVIPTMQAEGFNRPTLRFGFPVQWIAVPGLLKLHARPDLLLGFGTTAPYDPATMTDSVVTVGIYVDAGITLSVANFFIDLTVAYGGDVYPYKRGYVPFSMLVGYQVMPRLDVFAGFTLDNLTPVYGGAGDARSLTTGIQCRF